MIVLSCRDICVQIFSLFLRDLGLNLGLCTVKTVINSSWMCYMKLIAVQMSMTQRAMCEMKGND